LTKGFEIGAIVICPSSFDGTLELDSYRDANNKLAPGTSFLEAIPKSVTLVHEAFHTVLGEGVLAGDAEKCV